MSDLYRQTRLPIKPLVVFDINGVLCHRSRSKTTWTYRPEIITLLSHLATKYHIAFWTSMLPTNAKPIVTDITSHTGIIPVFLWYRRPEDVDPENTTYGTIKLLSKITARYPHYNESNVVMVDDSAVKMRFNPECSYIIVEPYTGVTDPNYQQPGYSESWVRSLTEGINSRFSL